MYVHINIYVYVCECIIVSLWVNNGCSCIYLSSYVITFFNKCSGKQKGTYGFKTAKSPDKQDELLRFEKDMQDLLLDIKFKRHQSEF